MKKLIIATCVFVALCSIITFAIVPNIKTTAMDQSSNANSSSSVTYIVKNFNGSVAVFEEGKDTPFKVTDTQVNTLPQADQEVLQSGIKVDSQNELTRLLEDYCS